MVMLLDQLAIHLCSAQVLTLGSFYEPLGGPTEEKIDYQLQISRDENQDE